MPYIAVNLVCIVLGLLVLSHDPLWSRWSRVDPDHTSPTARRILGVGLIAFGLLVSLATALFK